MTRLTLACVVAGICAVIPVRGASPNLAVHFRCIQIRDRPLVEAQFFQLLFHFVLFL